MIIPLNIEGRTKECVIELRDLSGMYVIATIFQGACDPGMHSIDFDPQKLAGDLDAGLYMLCVTIDGESQLFPIQYMP